jgi:hypothetical protein
MFHLHPAISRCSKEVGGFSWGGDWLVWVFLWYLVYENGQYKVCVPKFGAIIPMCVTSGLPTARQGAEGACNDDPQVDGARSSTEQNLWRFASAKPTKSVLYWRVSLRERERLSKCLLKFKNSFLGSLPVNSRGARV